jgi:broad specificity phosphatase PhoE
VADIVLVRHGQTEWSANGRHTSRTDLPLTAEGERQARAVGTALAGDKFVAVISSPRLRALATAQLAGLTVSTVDDDLVEWDYGDYEGLTTKEIRQTRPDWDLWTQGCPGGESPDQIAARLDRVLDRVRPMLDDGDVALISHGHALRTLAARWIGEPPTTGRRLKLDTATLSVLGHEHDTEVLQRWNQEIRGPLDS